MHGGAHTSDCYRATPDGRQGWAEYAASLGWPVVLPDWPGHGRSGRPADFACMSGMRVVEAIRAMLVQVGPAVLVTHSMSGAFGWKLTEFVPEFLVAVVGVAPSPPGNLQLWWSWPAYPEAEPIQLTPEEVRHFVASPRFPLDAFDAYFRSIVPESARIYNERLNARGMQIRVDDPLALRRVPMLVVSAARDPNHPGNFDAQIAEFVGAQHIAFADHGHLMMIEHGNLEILNAILDWLAQQVRPRAAAS